MIFSGDKTVRSLPALALLAATLISSSVVTHYIWTHSRPARSEASTIWCSSSGCRDEIGQLSPSPPKWCLVAQVPQRSLRPVRISTSIVTSFDIYEELLICYKLPTN